MHGITVENLIASLPPSLKMDRSVVALAEGAVRVLAARPDEIDLIRLYADIDRMGEELLDILAWDFKVDWWDADAPVEQKRRTLKDNWNIHRRLGTPWAVERELNNVLPGAQVEEWFEYGGKPYCFRVYIPEGSGHEWATWEKHEKVLKRIWYYKNLRSHLDGVEYVSNTVTPPLNSIGLISGLGLAVTETRMPNVEPEEERYHLYSSFRVGSGFHTMSVEPRVPNYEPQFDYRSQLGLAGGFGTASRDDLPRCEPPIRYKSRLQLGAAFQTAAYDSLPEAEPGLNFWFKLKVTGDHRSITRDCLPKIEPEYIFEPQPPEQEETYNFSGKLSIVSEFQRESVDAVPRLEAEHEFQSRMSVGSGMQNAAQGQLPKLEPVQEFNGEAGIGVASGILSGSDTELPDLSLDFEKEQSFDSRVNLITGVGGVSRSAIPPLEPEQRFEGSMLLASVTKLSGTGMALTRKSGQEPGQDSGDAVERVLKSGATVVSGLQEVTDTVMPRLEPEQKFKSEVKVASGMQNASDSDTPHLEPEIKGFSGNVAITSKLEDTTDVRIPTLEPERGFDGKVVIASAQNLGAGESELPRLEPAREFSGTAGIASWVQSDSDGDIPRLEPEHRFKGETGIASGTQSITETQV